MVSSSLERFNNEFDKLISEIKESDYTNDFYLDDSKDFEVYYLEEGRERFETIYRYLPTSRTHCTVLDIGTTPFTFLLKRLHPTWTVKTVDLTVKLNERAETEGVELAVVDLNRELLPFDDRIFDVVLFHEVIEHLFCNPVTLLEDINRTLADSGILSFGTTNIIRLYNRIRFLMGNSPLEIKERHAHGYGHVREFTINECLDILSQAGFSIETFGYREYGSLTENVFQQVPNPKNTPLRFFVAIVYYLLVFNHPSFQTYIYIKSIGG